MVQLPLGYLFEKVLLFNRVDGAHLVENPIRVIVRVYPSFKYSCEVFNWEKSCQTLVLDFVHVNMTEMLKYLYISSLSHSKGTAFELAGCVTDANCLIVFWLDLLIIAEVYQGTLFCDNRLFIESILICDPALRRREE